MKRILIISIFLFAFSANINAKEISCDFHFKEAQIKVAGLDLRYTYDVYSFSLRFNSMEQKIKNIVGIYFKKPVNNILDEFNNIQTEFVQNVFYNNNLSENEKSTLKFFNYLVSQSSSERSTNQNLNSFHKEILKMSDDEKKETINAIMSMSTFSMSKMIEDASYLFEDMKSPMELDFTKSINKIMNDNFDQEFLDGTFGSNGRRTFEGITDNGFAINFKINDNVLNSDKKFNDAVKIKAYGFDNKGEGFSMLASGDCILDEFIEDKSDFKSRLIELKSLLDDGLISQDQYDLKSSEILNDL